jgi:tetratricopeptide (TPR) repeat protein
MRRICLAIAVLLAAAAPFFLSSCRGLGSGGASITESRVTLPTYPYSDPDPVPILARLSMRGRGSRLYPYFSYEKFSAAATEKPWTVIRMENPYIEVSVLPEVGGKVWGAREKSTNREFLYTNHVLKFREIALRGPWTSGGIEFNFGIVGHGPLTASPVDYLVRKNPDGSASCVVGAMDLPSRTRWSVTITLPKDKAYFETSPFWHNPTPFSQSYYSWLCASVKAGTDLKYIFPGRQSIGHNYAVPLDSWPVDAEGRDVSWYKNNAFAGSKSYFTVGEYEDFYGGWYKDSNFGFGHWALYDDVPGRKVFIWGLSRAGEIWVDLLTDKDGQYTEPQAGRLLNQSDHGSFAPYTVDRWRELWFPYKDIGPMVKASPLGVLHADVSGNALSVGLFPLGRVDDDLVVSSQGKELFREHLSVRPAEVWNKKIPVTVDPESYEVRIGNRLVYSSDPKRNDLSRPLHFKVDDESTVEGLFLSASRLEKERNYQDALQKYLACLEKDPLHIRSLTRVAELYARRAEYQKALGYIHRALEKAMYDPEANYVCGVISRRTGKLVDAKETLGWAARSMEYRSAAYCQLAEISLLEGNHELALEYGGRSIDFNMYNSSAYAVVSTACRKSGQKARAKATLDKLLEFDPLNHLARFELYLLTPNGRMLDDFKSLIRSELSQETYLEVALYYVGLGCTEEAVAVLRSAPAHPTVSYWLAYLLKDRSREESRNYLERAAASSASLVFPFREEDIPVFEWASSQTPDDWKPKYYLGLIYWGKGRVAEATGLLESCDRADFPPLFIARASLFRDSNPERALADYERAVKMDEKNWRAWHALSDFTARLGKNEEALTLARKAAQLFPDNVPIQIDLVKACLGTNNPLEAARLLDQIQALPFEGASEIHGLYVKANVDLGLESMSKSDWDRALQSFEKSKLFPEQLGTGAPFEPDVRLQDYLEAVCHEKLGDRKKAEEIRRGITDYTIKHFNERAMYHYIGAVALRQSGDRQKADELMKRARLSQDLQEILKKWGR